VSLDAEVRVDATARELAEAGILVSTADAFATGPDRPHALRLALGGPDLDQLAPALRRVRSALTGAPPGPAALIDGRPRRR
jgi:DNA-binding transcriptional MocR family regulator